MHDARYREEPLVGEMGPREKRGASRGLGANGAVKLELVGTPWDKLQASLWEHVF